MLVHYIGGPRDGEREAVSELRSDRIQMPVARAIRYVPGELPPMSVPYDTVEYRVLRRERYAIAEYVEPKITTRWAITVKVADRYDYDALEAFRVWLTERYETRGTKDDVRCVAAQVHCGDEAELDFLVISDGPADPAGVATSAAKLQRWLEKDLPKGTVITKTEAATD